MTSTYANKPSLLVPVLTPFNAKLNPSAEHFINLCKDLLSSGADGLAVFGTTGEANSFSINERTKLLEELVSSGVDHNALMPGCGCCALTDTVHLVRHAIDLGCSGTLIMPSFFYRPVTDDGVFALFSEIIERIGDERLRVYLYHFPKMSGVPITPNLIEKLLKRYPTTIAGLKDSSGIWEDTAVVINSFPSLDVYSGSESLLSRNLSAGGGGCISATANVNARAIRHLIDNHASPEAPKLQAEIDKVRKVFENYPIIETLKAFIANKLNDENWSKVRPPLLPLPEQKAATMLAELAATELITNAD